MRPPPARRSQRSWRRRRVAAATFAAALLLGGAALEWRTAVEAATPWWWMLPVSPWNFYDRVPAKVLRFDLLMSRDDAAGRERPCLTRECAWLDARRANSLRSSARALAIAWTRRDTRGLAAARRAVEDGAPSPLRYELVVEHVDPLDWWRGLPPRADTVARFESGR